MKTPSGIAIGHETNITANMATAGSYPRSTDQGRLAERTFAFIYKQQLEMWIFHIC